MTDISLFKGNESLSGLLASKRMVEVWEKAENWLDRHKGFAILRQFNEGILSKVSRSHGITVVLPLNLFIEAEGAEKAKELENLRSWVKFLQMYSIEFTFASFGKDEGSMRNEWERETICSLLGLDESQAKNIVGKIERISE
jgi:hypothetical protein